MRTWLVGAALTGAATCAHAVENSDIRFFTEAGELRLAAGQIAEATPWFDDGAAGINIRLDAAAGDALAGLTRASIGRTMSFAVCGETLVSATVQTTIEGGRIAAVTDGLGEATWYARILRGEIGCDGRPLE